MKTTFPLTIMFLLGCFDLSGQVNLVPNSNLDTFVNCPNNGSQIIYAAPWTDASGGSTDYLNACSSVMPVPYVYLNYSHNSHSGSGMAGIWLQQSNDYREYLQVQLLDTLEGGVSYWVEFYVFLCHGTSYGVNNVGAYFSTNALQQAANNAVIFATPQILLPGNPVITDTLQWTRISACYQAVGGERFITIGNFCDNSNTDTVTTLGNYPGAYYFIDDVGVTQVDTLAISEQNNFSMLCFPNPSNTMTIFQFAGNPEAHTVIVFDPLGREIWRKESSAMQIEFPASEFGAGIYSYQIDGATGSASSGNIVVTH